MARHRTGVAIVLAGLLLAAACGRSDDSSSPTTTGGTADTGTAACDGVDLQATDVGITADTITIQVMADTGSPLAPGLFQGNIDAVKGYADYINAKGGIACRKLVVNAWDSKLDPTESKNGLITACRDSFAAVGGNSLFNPDVTPMTTCPDATGAATGLPDVAGLTADITEACAPTTFSVQPLGDQCPVTTGTRPVTQYWGYWKWLLEQNPDLKSLFMVPGDLPTTVLASTPILEGQRQAGIDVVAGYKVSGRDEQAAYTPKVQAATSLGANMIYNNSNDVAMVKMRQEAEAQNLQGIDVWACSIACYTDAFKQAGSTVDGTYVGMTLLPFEEKDQNQELANYLDHVPSPSSWGANGWQAAVLFNQAVDRVVEKDGPNGLTRAKLLDALTNFGTFDANGWMAPLPIRGVGSCGLVMQIEGGEFRRVYPTEPGTFECHPEFVQTIQVDPSALAATLQ
jgi:ABC-type branched-subunit amino acid transport system substrate-binding protein